MRGGSAVMSNLMHRSFLFAVKAKDMMHKGVECASPCTALNTIARKCASSISALSGRYNDKLVGNDRDIAIRCVADSGEGTRPRT